jgi:hypothetical protein
MQEVQVFILRTPLNKIKCLFNAQSLNYLQHLRTRSTVLRVHSNNPCHFLAGFRPLFPPMCHLVTLSCNPHTPVWREIIFSKLSFEKKI